MLIFHRIGQAHPKTHMEEERDRIVKVLEKEDGKLPYRYQELLLKP